jgi:hypothetical protein
MKSYSHQAKVKWRRRAAQDLRLRSVTPMQRRLLDQMWENQVATEQLAKDDTTNRLRLQRAFMKLIQTVRTLEHAP